MSDEMADILNSDPGLGESSEAFGLDAKVADEDHAAVEMHATNVNKYRGYWVGSGLLMLAEAAGNALVNRAASVEAGEFTVGWYATNVSARYEDNSRGESVVAESRWETQSEHEATVVATIRDGETVLATVTTRYTKR